jgi:hypothetical protein
VPNPVSELLIAEVTPTTITVAWDSRHIAGNHSSYEVTYSPADGRTPSPSSLLVSRDFIFFTLEGLSPNAEYTVSVVTLSGSGNNLMKSTPKQQTRTTGE